MQPVEVQPTEVQSAEVQPTEVQKTVLSSGEIRKGASKSYASVGKVTSGQTVKVIDTFKNSLGETWYRLDMNSFKGWVQAAVFEKSSVTLPPANIPIKGDSVYTANNSVKARSGATTSYKVVATLPLNKQLTVVDTFNNAKGETWIRVQISSKTYGWIPLSELQEEAMQVKTLYISASYSQFKKWSFLKFSCSRPSQKRHPINVHSKIR